MKIFTIGFTKKSAEDFFHRLEDAGVKKVIDIRLHNASQLAGFAKKDDLKYFLQEITQIDYSHNTDLAPTEDILNEYQKKTKDWSVFEKKFLKLIERRKIEKLLTPRELSSACLLCSEDKPHHCHRRFVAEYLQKKWKNVEVIHL